MSQLKQELQAVGRQDYQIFPPFEWTPDLKKAAVLVLFQGDTFLDSEIFLTLRSKETRTHPGQVAFPGGAVEEVDQGSEIRAALRECFEETGILEAQIEPLVTLPGFQTVSGGYGVMPVIGQCLVKNPRLKLQPEEVTFAEWISVRALQKSREIEKRIVRGVEMELPVFWWNEEKMWGLSALIFDLILKRYDRL